MITFKFKEVWSPISKSNVMAKKMIKKPLEFKFWWENKLISRFQVGFEIELPLLHIILH